VEQHKLQPLPRQAFLFQPPIAQRPNPQSTVECQIMGKGCAFGTVRQ
jgi:hypothetical protein